MKIDLTEDEKNSLLHMVMYFHLDRNGCFPEDCKEHDCMSRELVKKLNEVRD